MPTRKPGASINETEVIEGGSGDGVDALPENAMRYI
jgi:hypothetical protein